MAFNRDRNSRGGGGFRPRPRFGDRGDRGSVEMHKAICDNCGRECEVPFRPTHGKPVFCSNCFQSQKGSEPRSDRPMFEAVCDNCGNSCKVPFQPSGDKPIYCSNCFGEKKGAGSEENGQFEALNQKLDKILQLLETKPVKKKSPKKTK